MFGLTLISVIVITGGVIAFLGDRIGTRVGKKRLSLWGLRPRYTSIIITILTGIFIAASTLGVLTLLSLDARTALFGMEAVKKQTQELQAEVTQRTAALAAARAELEQKNTEYVETHKRMEAITREIHSLQASKLELQASRQALEERIAALNAEKSTLQQDIDRLNALTANLQQGLANVRVGTIVLRAGEVLSVGVLQGGGSRADLERRLNDYMSAANQRLRERFQIADEKTELIFIPRSHAEEVIAFLAAHPENVVLRLLSAGNVVVGEPVIGQFEVFPNKQVYAAGTVILSDRLTYSGDPKDAEQVISIFLRRVNEAAVQQGMIPDPLQGTVGVVSVEKYFEVVNQLRRMKGTVELIATARQNVFSADPLQIDLQLRQVF